MDAKDYLARLRDTNKLIDVVHLNQKGKPNGKGKALIQGQRA